MTRILLIGFSVTEGGFGDKLKARLESAETGLSMDVVSIGGVHPQPLMHLVDLIAPDETYDVICYEIDTSGYRKYYQPDKGVAALVPFLVLASKAKARGARPIFLNLPRGDYDLATDFMRPMFTDLERIMGVTVIDVATETYAAFAPEHMRDAFFRNDGHFSHPHTDEQNWLVERSAEHLTRVLAAAAPDVDAPDFSGAAMFVAAAGPGDRFRFERRGLVCDCLVIPEGETVSMPVNAYVTTMSFLTHPRAGAMMVEANGKTRTVPGLDPASYYMRLTAQPIVGAFTDHVTITQTADATMAKPLNKGSLSTEPRLGLIAGFSALSEPLSEIESRAAKLVAASRDHLPA